LRAAREKSPGIAVTQPDGTAGSDAGGEGKGECSQSV
jgi:hypothetical protein